jgi:hypothetical protein
MNERLEMPYRRTTRFQLVFRDTELGSDLALEVGQRTDPEWLAAGRLMLDALAAEASVDGDPDAAWGDLIAWLHADGRLDTYLRRSLQSLDASVALLTVVLPELASDPAAAREWLEQRFDELPLVD